MTFYFAWVPPEETTFAVSHEREDEDVFAFEITHDEGDFPSLSIDVKNPKVGLLTATRDVWAWLSYNDGSSVEPLFFGRLVGAPQEMQNEIVRLLFVAKPSDWEDQKNALAETLKVRPYWDPVWINPDRRNIADSVLEARPEMWHVDRVTHEVTTSNITSGEDGTVNQAANFFYDSLNISLNDAPVRRVYVKGEVSWDQFATGTVDMKRPLLDAFQDAGTSEPFMISSYTGGGLADDWPEEGDNIGSGWEVGESFLQRADGTAVAEELVTTINRDASIGTFPLWRFIPTFKVNYEASRSRREIVTFTIEADVQPILTEAGEDEVLAIEISSADVDQPIDPFNTAENSMLPIGDPARASYFITDRGHESVEYLIALAVSRLQSRARAVVLRFDASFETGLTLSCRQNFTIADDRLPGGTATGKVISYVISANGDTGELKTTISIGCTIGKGNSVSASAGTPDYCETAYCENDYQTFTSQVVAPISGTVTYVDYTNTALDDDGVDFFNMNHRDVLLPTTDGDGLFVINGEADQYAVLNAGWEGIEEAANAINEIPTQVDLTLVPLKTGPFETTFSLTVSDVMIPKTIDLEAA